MPNPKPALVTTLCPDCLSFKDKRTCAFCDGARIPCYLLNPRDVVWPTVLLKLSLAFTSACGYSEYEMQLMRDRQAELTAALQECGKRIQDTSTCKGPP